MKKLLANSVMLCLVFIVPSAGIAETTRQKDSSTERRWIKKRKLSTPQGVKIYIDGQPKLQLHPRRDDSGNIYIRKHELREWIERRKNNE